MYALVVSILMNQIPIFIAFSKSGGWWLSFSHCVLQVVLKSLLVTAFYLEEKAETLEPRGYLVKILWGGVDMGWFFDE